MPAATPVARPVVEIVAVAVVSDVQVAVDEMFAFVPSVIVAVAVNCCVAVLAIVAITGVTAIVATAAGVTVRVMWPTIEPVAALLVAVMSDVPTATPDGVAALVERRSRPSPSCAVADIQVTVAVRTCVDPSE